MNGNLCGLSEREIARCENHAVWFTITTGCILSGLRFLFFRFVEQPFN